MVDARVFHSIAEIDRDAWNACFPAEIETHDYLRAIEASALAGFSWRYATVFDGASLIAAAPAFVTDYALDTTLSGLGKRIVQGVRRVLPGALRLRLGAIGSPCTETACLGFSDAVSTRDKPAVLRALMRGFEAEALRSGCGLLAVKDALGGGERMWDDGLADLGYRAIPGLPVAVLDIEFATLEDYLARLSPGTRKDMRRKLRGLGEIRIEHRTEISDVLGEVVAIYNETLARAELQFEELSPAYFENVLAMMPGKAFFVLYYAGETLVGFNLLLQDQQTLLDKFFCMKALEGRKYSLYFLSWFTNIGLCLERGLKHYQSGQAGYENKLRLGSRLTPTAMYFRHRNTLVSRAMQLAAPLFVPDPTYAHAP